MSTDTSTDTSIVRFFEIQRDWSLRTFGEHIDHERVLRHIESEIEEVRAAPDEIEEWVDIAILAFDGALRAGYSPNEVAAALYSKMIVNMQRKWELSADGLMRHVKNNDGGRES